MARDSLRATLDELKIDERSAKDRPYLEAMLRRLGYTETEIRAELGPPLEAAAPPQDFATDDDIAPAREYRLVIPARESAFAFESPTAIGGPDSPFEDFERVEFEESPALEETVEFSEVAETEPPMPFTEAGDMPLEEFQQAPTQEFAEAPVEDLQADETTEVEDVSIDTFGGPDVDTQTKTRVRMKRVRARSKAEAESKVSSGNRRVIKSIPVDIVERWGGAEKPAADKGERKAAKKGGTK